MSPAGSATVRDALEGAVGALEAAGVENPRLDAELLLAEAAGWPRERLHSHPEDELPPGASREFGAMVRRRSGREPVAYIVGRKGFRRLQLAVDRRVLIPRPESELLVELALELEPEQVLEVGTGSGAIALAIADELSDAEVFATDLSRDALAVAALNADRLGLSRRLHLAYGSVPAEPPRFDLLVANLPYVSAADWDGLAPEITGYEPREALVPGPLGLEAIDSMLGEVAMLERRPDAVALEVGEGQAGLVSELVGRTGYGRVETRRDLAGIERVVLGR